MKRRCEGLLSGIKAEGAQAEGAQADAVTLAERRGQIT